MNAHLRQLAATSRRPGHLPGDARPFAPKSGAGADIGVTTRTGLDLGTRTP